MVKKSLLPFLLLACLWGCHKENEKNESVFRGLVIDYDTDTPKPNTIVILRRFDGLVNASPDMYIGIVQDSVLTDNNGKYCFNIDHNDKFLYKITTRLNGYLVKNQLQGTLAKIIDYYPVNTDTIRIGKAGYVKLDLVNIPDGYDSVFIYDNHYSTEYLYSYHLYPQLNDTAIINGYLYKDSPSVNIKWEIINKPENNVGSAMVSLSPQDTVTVTINY